jgi:hypothetical protein
MQQTQTYIIGFSYEKSTGCRYRQCFLFDKSCRKMYTIFSAVLRQQRKSDVMTSFGQSARSTVYYTASSHWKGQNNRAYFTWKDILLDDETFMKMPRTECDNSLLPIPSAAFLVQTAKLPHRPQLAWPILNFSPAIMSLQLGVWYGYLLSISELFILLDRWLSAHGLLPSIRHWFLTNNPRFRLFYWCCVEHIDFTIALHRLWNFPAITELDKHWKVAWKPKPGCPTGEAGIQYFTIEWRSLWKRLAVMFQDLGF